MEFLASLQSGIDEHKPSLFELLAEQQLASLIPPSLRYLLARATYQRPRYLLRVLNSFDELYALLSLIVERYYLRTYGGGFTENFYGLKRERVLRTKNGEIPRAQLGAASLVRETLKLRDADVWRNLAVMVGLPYVKRKLDESYDIHAPQAAILGPSFARDALPPNPSAGQTVMHYYKWFLRKVYPSVNAAYYFALLAFNMAYLFDSSKYYSPFLWLVGTRMRRLGEADYAAIAAATEAPQLVSGRAARPGQASSIFHPRTFFQVVYSRLLSSLKILLPASIFALKFLEWWHASDFARQLSRRAAEGLELPPPVISGLPSTKLRGSSASRPSALKSSSATASPEKGRAEVSSKSQHPVSSLTSLPIFTVPSSPPDTSDLCPICNTPVTTATATPFGYVYCYSCIHKWVEGVHDRQTAFMEGASGEEEVWGDVEGDHQPAGRSSGSRESKWESGKGRDAVTGRRILGGTGCLRRVIV